MKRAILALLLSAVSLFAGEPWPGVQFTEVRAYAWPDEKKTSWVILPGMTLKPGVFNNDGAVLTPPQIKRLLAAVNGKHPAHLVAFANFPANAFVFYNGPKTPVAYIEICFGCFNSRLEPASATDYLDLVSLASIFAEHTLPIGGYADLAAFEKDFDGVNLKAK